VSTPPGPVPQRVRPAPAPPPATSRSPGAAPRRTLWLLTLGHLCTGLGAVPVALFAGPGPHEVGLPFFVQGAIAAGVLGLGQVLSGLNLALLARAGTDLDTRQVVRTLRRAEWAGGPIVVAIIGQATLVSLPPAAPASLAPFALPTVAVLLEAFSLAWLHRRMRTSHTHGLAAEHHWLPPGAGRRVRALFRRSVVGCVVYGGFAALLLVATTTRHAAESHGPAGASPGAALQIIAAAAVTVMPFLPIRGYLRLRLAVSGDALHIPALRLAGESVRRAGAAAVVLLAVVMAATPTTPPDAIDLHARPVLASLVLVILASQLVEVARLGIGDIPKRLARWR
jgi:hypothetical protein